MRDWSDIRDLNHLFGPDHLSKGALWMRLERPRLERIGVGRGQVVKRCPPNGVPFKQIHRAEFGSANSRRVLQEALENRLQIAGRAADDLKNLGRSGLPLQRFSQFESESCNLLF